MGAPAWEPSTSAMSAELQNREAGTLGTRRIVCQYISEALSALNGARPSDVSIHAARKSIKRTRAVWRLLEPALPAAAFRDANRRLRNAARPLGAARDARILVVALDRLLQARGGVASAGGARGFRRALMRHASAIKHGVMFEPGGLELSREELRGAYQRIQARALEKRGWAVIGKGMRRVYARGRRLYRSLPADARADQLHEWRKQVKSLHHQFAVLRPLAVGPIGKLASQAGKLSERLGDDHDLAVLRTEVLAHRHAFSSAARQAGIIAAIDRRRTYLQKMAFKLGARIYADKPHALYARFGGYWHDWRRAKNQTKT